MKKKLISLLLDKQASKHVCSVMTDTLLKYSFSSCCSSYSILRFLPMYLCISASLLSPQRDKKALLSLVNSPSPPPTLPPALFSKYTIGFLSACLRSSAESFFLWIMHPLTQYDWAQINLSKKAKLEPSLCKNANSTHSEQIEHLPTHSGAAAAAAFCHKASLFWCCLVYWLECSTEHNDLN